MTKIAPFFDILAEPFAVICNMSFASGTFPTLMKSARVTPLFKQGLRHLPSNYRPISEFACIF